MSDLETSRFSSTLTATLSTIAVIGIIAQLYAYIAAHGFFLAYAVNPAELEITPLNALLRLTSTTILIAGILVCILGLFGLIISYSDTISNWIQRTRRLRSPGYQFSFGLIAVVTLISIGATIFNNAHNAGYAAKRGGNSHSFPYVSLFLSVDLGPRPVLIEWHNPDDIPTPLQSSTINFFTAQLLGQNGDRYVFYLKKEHLLVRVEGAAVNIYTFLPVDHLSGV